MGNFCSGNCSPCFLFPVGSNLKRKSKPDSFEYLVNSLVTTTVAEDKMEGGVSRTVFTRYVFSKYIDFSNRFFSYLADAKFTTVPPVQFITKEKFNTKIRKMIDFTSYDELCLRYLSLYSADNITIELDQFRSFFVFVYDISMDNHPDGPQYCTDGESMISSMVDSVYRQNVTQQTLDYVLKWTDRNTPRLIGILHNFIINELKVLKRNSTIDEQDQRSSLMSSRRSVMSQPDFNIPLSRIWSLFILLPAIYTKQYDETNMLLPELANTSQTSQSFFLSDLDILPVHWKLLYESSYHGCSGNRFSYHVFGYKGPTLMLLKCENNKEFCVCVSEEWRESHRAWGDKYCYLVQLLPIFYLIDQGSKLVYLNFNIKGFPLGMRLGTDRNKPFIIINDQLNRLTYRGKAFSIYSLEVWGCGSLQTKNLFIRLKKKKEDLMRNINDSMTVKGSVSHPDKYLMDLANFTPSNSVV